MAESSAINVTRRLGKAGLKGCKARKKPTKSRLEWVWVGSCRYFTEEHWVNIMWSNEYNFHGFILDLYKILNNNICIFVIFTKFYIKFKIFQNLCVPTVNDGEGNIMVRKHY